MGLIPDLTDDEWAELTERLTLHAQRKMGKLYWRGVTARRGVTAPGGVSPQDLASEAIISIIEGKRQWDAKKHPDLRQFLEGVIDSKVNHRAESPENRVTRRETVSPDGVRIEPRTAKRNPERDPADLCCDQDAAARFQALVEKEIGGDADLGDVFECIKAEITKPQEIADVLGRDVTEINNIQKRLRRRVDNAMRRHAARGTS